MEKESTSKKTKILFVCHGNICRSPMAEFVMKKLAADAGRDDLIIESAALHTDEIGNDIHHGTRTKLRERSVPFTPRAAWLLTAAKAREYDYLVGMDDYNIADPWYTGNFDVTYDDVLAGCRGLLARLQPSAR